jgi:hypothetical protein
MPYAVLHVLVVYILLIQTDLHAQKLPLLWSWVVVNHPNVEKTQTQAFLLL